jgi:hypothetical protein
MCHRCRESSGPDARASDAYWGATLALIGAAFGFYGGDWALGVAAAGTLAMICCTLWVIVSLRGRGDHDAKPDR